MTGARLREGFSTTSLGFMMLSRKASTTFFLVAMLSSLPLALLIAFSGALHTGGSAIPELPIMLLFIAPVIVGAVSVLWLNALMKFCPHVWHLSPAVSGSVVGVLSFVTYVVAVAFGAEAFTRTSWLDALLLIGGYGLLLFGWVPLVLGAFGGWLAGNIERSGAHEAQPARRPDAG
jgi:hypothetical protein